MNQQVTTDANNNVTSTAPITSATANQSGSLSNVVTGSSTPYTPTSAAATTPAPVANITPQTGNGLVPIYGNNGQFQGYGVNTPAPTTQPSDFTNAANSLVQSGKVTVSAWNDMTDDQKAAFIQANPTAPSAGLQYNDLVDSQTNNPPKFDAQGMLVPGTGGLSAQGFQAATASGTKPPQDAGAAKTAVSSFTPTAPPDTSHIDTALSADPGYQQLLQDQATYNSTANQQQTLLSQYQQMSQAAGIPALQQQLLDTNKIINGTEDDIRKEVQASGGFATDSQVLALASARNKTLIQNANNLQATLTAAQNNVSTMIGLADKDQSNALDKIKTKLQIDQQVIDNTNKMTAAAQEGYNTVIKAAGYQGLLQSLNGDPNAIALAEKTLGLQPGGLQSLVNVQQAQTNQATAQSAGVSTQFANQNGTFFNAKTGQAYSNPQDFFKAAGVTSFPDAYSKGLVTDIGANSALKSGDTEVVTANGRSLLINKLTGQTIQDLGTAYKGDSTNPTSTDNVSSMADQLNSVAGKDGYISPQDYKKALTAWQAAGQSAASFKTNFSNYLNPADLQDYD